MTPQDAQKMVRSLVGKSADDYDSEALSWIANGPLCDPSGHFCPAGRLSWPETYRREASQVLR